MSDRVPQYNITIHAGTDYQIDLSLVADDDTEITDYGAYIFDEVLNDGTGSEVDEDNEMYLPSEEDWTAIGDTLIYIGSEEIIIGGWRIEAQLREYPESSDHFDFGNWMDQDGYHLTLSHNETKDIPFTQGVYDVFIENVETGIRSKLLYGNANIIRRTAR